MTVMMLFTSHYVTRWPRPLVALVVARAVNQLGAFALAFLAVALVEVYGASLATAGWVVASFGIATIPSRLVGGRLADRFGRRPTIVAGLVGCAAALGVIAASPGVPGAAVGAVLLGCAFEVYEPPSQALLAELVPAHRRPQAFGLLGAALAVAAFASGLLAVVLGGVDLRLLFVADGASCMIAAVLVVLLVRDPSPPTRRRVAGGSPWRDERLLVMLAVGTGSALAWNLATTTLPLTVTARGLDPARTGWLLAVAAVVSVLGQRLLRGASLRPFALMAAGLVLVAAGFAIVAYAAGLLLLGVGSALVALGQVFLLGPPYAVVAGLARDGSRAGYLAAYGTCWGIAQTIGPVISTRLWAIGIPVPWLAGAALCLALATLQPVAARLVLDRTGRITGGNAGGWATSRPASEALVVGRLSPAPSPVSEAVEEVEALLEVESGGYVAGVHAESHHGEGDVGLDADDDGRRSAETGHLGDVTNHATSEGVEDVEGGNVDDDADGAVMTDGPDEVMAEPRELGVVERRVDGGDEVGTLPHDRDG